MCEIPAPIILALLFVGVFMPIFSAWVLYNFLDTILYDIKRRLGEVEYGQRDLIRLTATKKKARQ